MVAETFAVEAFGIDGAVFLAEPDPETNFKLFGPVACAATGAETTSRAFALRLRPNQDFAGALETFCRERGITRAKLHGGVGSTIGARFTDGRIVEPFATELAVSAGVIAPGASGALEAELDVALVDYTGGLAEGRLHARRQSGADDDGAGAGGGGGRRLVARRQGSRRCASLPTKISKTTPCTDRLGVSCVRIG